MNKVLNAAKNIGLSSIISIAVLAVLFILILLVVKTPKQIPAFPSAEGFGAYTTGGRGGVVYHVRTLKDTNEAGSLRYAIQKEGARTIVFDVSGIIELNSPLVINNPNLTIAGQTAPGDGICIKDYPVIVNTDNVIVRFVRFRIGDKTDASSLVVNNRQNIIIDHCSLSWSSQDNVNLFNNRNLTMQWCIISEALNNSIAKGFGATLGGYNASYHHNLFANNRTSSPAFYNSIYNSNLLNVETIDFRNNVLYNWGTSSVDGATSGTYNLINNYYKYGPATNVQARSQIIEVKDTEKSGFVYVAGNYVYINPLQTNDNWMGVYPNMDYIKTSKNAKLTHFQFEHEPVHTHTALRAYDKVTKYAGTSLSRDLVDRRIVESLESFAMGVKTDRGLISSPRDIGNYPKYESEVALLDSDDDGIPDKWEYVHNLNPYDAGDGKSMTKNGYTNLEIYLNSLVKDIEKNEYKGTLPNEDSFRLFIRTMAKNVKK